MFMYVYQITTESDEIVYSIITAYFYNAAEFTLRLAGSGCMCVQTLTLFAYSV